MGRLLLGIVKGGVIGAAIGLAALKAGFTSGVMALLAYGLVGAMAGLLCGRPLWRQETMWTSILKGLFGFGLGVGLAFAARKWLGGVHVPIAFIPGATTHALPDVPLLLGPAIGIIYGALVEVDDAGGASAPEKK